jgi:hypothetical protein
MATFPAEIMSHSERNPRLFEKADRPGQKVMHTPRKPVEVMMNNAIRKILLAEDYNSDVAVTVRSVICDIGLAVPTLGGLH